MNNRNLPLLIDIIFCVILLPAMIMLLPVERWLTHHTGFVLLLVIWLYAVYFINRKWTVPMVFGKNRYLPAVIILAATVFLTWLLIRMDMPGDFFRHRGHAVHHRFFRLGPREQGVWFLFLVVTTFSVAVGLLTELYRQMLRRKELEQEKSRAELALYKAQINPHFLFNTLNTIYGMILTHSDRTEQAFMQFIGMVKYLYSKASSDFIPVTEEIAPGYFDTIAKPMDLQTMERRLLRFRDYYKRPEVLRVDIELMVENCKTFNGQDTMYYKLAVQCLQRFKALFHQTFTEPSS